MNQLNGMTSQQIMVCRIFCIFFMTMVHLPPGASTMVDLPQPLHGLSIITQDVLGRGSVSVLSLISGFLIVFSIQKSTFATLALNKFNTLIIPMAIWNIALLVLGLAIYSMTGVETMVYTQSHNIPVTELIVNRIFALHYGAATQSLNFLRDIFVCALLAPALIYAIKKWHVAALLLLLLIDFTITFQPLVMRGQILLFFSMGIYLAIHHQTIRLPNFVLGLAACFVPLMIISEFNILNLDGFSAYEILKRATLCVFILYIADLMANKIPTHWLKQADKSVYFTFLAHNVFFLLVWGVWQLTISDDARSTEYLIFFIFTPVLWFAVAFFIYPIFKYLPNVVQIAVIGKARKKANSINFPPSKT